MDKRVRERRRLVNRDRGRRRAWLIFLVAFMILGGVSWLLLQLERVVLPAGPAPSFRREVAHA